MGVTTTFANLPDGLSPMSLFDAAFAQATNAVNVSYTPSGGVTSVNVQAAITELDTKKAAISSLSSVATSGAAVDLVTIPTAWTPVLTFVTPGDLAVTYTTQFGRYVKLSNNMLLAQFVIVTSAFTFTTASGNLQITGLPFTSQNTTGLSARGALSFGGINKTSYSQVVVGMAPNTSLFVLNASGMGVAATAVTATDTPTGGTINLSAEIVIFL